MRSHNQHKALKPKPSLEQILLADCGVCFATFEKIPPKKLDEGLEILFCSKCHIHVHRGCYDFEPISTVISDRVSQFVCDRCSRQDLAQLKCLVCLGQDGAMKLIGQKQVIHVYCGLMHNDIQVTSYFPSIKFKKSVHYEETSHSCEVCHNKNAHQQCAQESCKRKVHVYCAKKTYVLSAKQAEQPKCWNHKISAGNHGTIDLSDEIIPYELFAEEVETNLKELEQLGLNISSKQDLKKKIHKQYLEQIRSRRKSTKKLRRGGFSYVVCPQHESNSYCTCFGKVEGEQMVLCQCCFEWYHHKCVKYVNQENSYICQYCKTFYQFKRRAIQQIRGGRVQYELSKVEMPLKISVMDVMWVMRIIDNRIRGGLAQKMLKQLSKYPLKSSCMDLLIRQQNRIKLTALADDCLTQFSTSEQLLSALRPRPVLAVDNQGKPYVVSTNVDFNRLVRKGIELLQGMGFRGQGFAAILRELEFKERALSDQYEQIIELSKVEQKYQEVQILKQKAQAYNFIEIIKKINEKATVSYIELKDAIQKVNSISTLPRYLSQTLVSKYNTVSPIIQNINQTIANNPENIYQITQLIEQLQSFNIESPPQYLQLKMEKKFIQDLYLYYIKQEGHKMEEELTIQQKIDNLLLCESLRASQELIDILNSYNPSSNIRIWKNINEIAQKCQATAIEFEIKEVIKRRYCKQEKFLSIMQRAFDYNFSSNFEDVTKILQNWKEIQVNYELIVNKSLEKSCQYEDLSKDLLAAISIIDILQNFPVKIEEDNPKNSILAFVKNRKEQLEQLKILYTQAQLQKNPLTIHKLIPTIPKANPLVKQWTALKKQQSNFYNKFTTILARINEKLQNFRTQKKQQRKDQIRINNQKPSINEIAQFIEVLKHSNIDMSKQIRELTRITNNSLQIASKTKKYIELKGDCNLANLEELSNRRKDIEELRKKVLVNAELNLKNQLIELYHMEICNRMRTALLSPGLELQKISTLLKFAQEESLTHVQTYIALKDKFQTKNQKSKEVSLIKHLQHMLATQAAKDTTGYHSHLFVYRKSLVLPEINESKTKNQFIDDMVDKNKALRDKISNMLQQIPFKWEYNEAKNIYLQALKNPYFQPDINRLSHQITKTFQLLRRWKELNKSFNHLHPIFLDYQLLTFTIEEIQIVKRQLRNNQSQIGKLGFYVSNFDQNWRDQMEQILQRVQSNSIIKESEICREAQQKYIKYWVKLLQKAKQVKKMVPFEKIRRLLLDSYNLLQKNLKMGQDYDQLKTTIYQLQDYMILIKSHLRQHQTYNKSQCIVANFIDTEDFYLENEDEGDLAELVPLLKPFSDLSKFRVKNLQRLQNRKQELQLKRSRDKLDDFKGDSEKHIVIKQDEHSSSSEAPQVVGENERKKIKDIFLKNIRKNPELRKYGECQNQVKMIENQIFGEWHNDIEKYFLTSEQFQKLFIKLINCPNISNKIIKKKFEFKFIQILISNLSKIDELQGLIVNKIKEQQTQKTITKMSESVLEKQMSNQNENEAVIESIASGKVNQSLRQDIKKQMKILKESKHKKKKHHKHRSRSKSPDAKFSSESEELPSYIQNEYNKDQTKMTDKKIQLGNIKLNQSPLRYDPEEEELENRQTIHPKGSILKLKTCDIEIISKKRGRIQFPVQILTEEQHKKILTQLVDPNFTRLSIRKDKNEAQIIQYISKSKKKYKYLVCWFEAINANDNEWLKEMSADANEKKKIFGWQNEHIKIHIMSIKQLVQISRFNAPARVSSSAAAITLNNDRMIIIIQYPEKVYQIKDNYKPFADIQRKKEEFQVFVPAPVIQAPPIYDYYPKYTIPTIQPLNKQYQQPKLIYQGGWGNDTASLPLPSPQPITPIQNIPVSMPQQNNLPYKVNQIINHFGLGSFSPILSDEDDTDDKNKQDLASNLLNSLGDFGKQSAPPPAQSIHRQKSQQQHQHQQQPHQQQQYQNYYGNYGYQQAPRHINSENRWGYNNMNQGMGQQPLPQQQSQVYNPLNPMAGKYPPPQPQPQQQMPNPMYKNPMMGQRPISSHQPPINNQYYRPPNPNEGYDSRYHGYQQ